MFLDYKGAKREGEEIMSTVNVPLSLRKLILPKWGLMSGN